MNKLNKILFRISIVGIIVLTIGLRLYHISYSIADWHSWRQADTAAVARNFLKFGFDPLHPRYDDLSNVQSGKENPNGWRMVEFPLYQLAGAGMKLMIPQLSIEIALRLVTIISSAGTCFFLILLVTQYLTPGVGLLAGLLFAVLPYNVYYGRSILPESFMVFFSMLSIYLFDISIRAKKNSMWFMVFSAISAAVAILVKPMAVFFLLPVVYLFVFKVSFRQWWKGFILAAIVLFPFWWWRVWIAQFPEGIPASDWLLNGGNIRFKGAWFQWLFAERISKLILGYWGVGFLVTGLVASIKKEGWFFRWFGFGALLYFVVFARGNVQHDYYQIPIVVALCIYMAKGIQTFFRMHETNKVTTTLVVGAVSLFMLAFSWYTIRSYYWINRQEIVDAGKMADKILPKDAKVIAPYGGDTAFLYQTNRQGWPVGFDIDKKISMGATHYVTVNNDEETNLLAGIYTVLIRNDKFVIIDLTKKQ
jgi:hypothetical protein